jgi:hypothetical protein
VTDDYATPPDDSALDAYSRVVTRVAHDLLTHVASVHVRGTRRGASFEGGGSAVVFTWLTRLVS